MIRVTVSQFETLEQLVDRLPGTIGRDTPALEIDHLVAEQTILVSEIVPEGRNKHLGYIVADGTLLFVKPAPEDA